MANKRMLKKGINVICESILAECVAVSLYGSEEKKAIADDLFFATLKLQDHYVRRVSHPEPGINAKSYYKDLRNKFSEQVTEVIDQINA